MANVLKEGTAEREAALEADAEHEAEGGKRLAEVLVGMDEGEEEVSARAVLGAIHSLDGLIDRVNRHVEPLPTEDGQTSYWEHAGLGLVASDLWGVFGLGGGEGTLACPPSKLDFYFRMTPTWTSGGAPVIAKPKRYTGLLAAKFPDTLAAVVVHLRKFRDANPLQRVWMVYHGMRQVDEEGRLRPYTFGGFIEEPMYFGVGIWESYRAAEWGLGHAVHATRRLSEYQNPQFGLFEGDDG